MNRFYSLVAAALAVALAPAAARAELLIALTTANTLITFDSATPGTTTAPVAIGGLAADEAVLGIDIRPATQGLYGLTSANRLIVIDPGTGAITSSVALSQALAGTSFGVDFNPVLDRFRVVNELGNNYNVNPNNGAVLTQTALFYPANGDPNSGTTPAVVAAAYTNNYAGAASTTLFDLDSAFGFLAKQNPPASGALTSVNQFGLGFAVDPDAAFDISGATKRGYAVLDGLNLYEIDTAGGTATLIGAIDTQSSVRGIAAAAVPAPAGLVLLASGAVGGLAARRVRRRA